MRDPSLLERLRERKLVQWALAYLAGAWVIYEATGTALEAWDIPLLLVRSIHVLLLFGLPLTLILAWYHGEKGRQRVSGPELLLVAAVLLAAGGVLTVLPGEEEALGPGDIGPIPVVDSDRPSIAILPLENISPSQDDAFFAVGMHEELTNRISKVSGLFVISRTSTEQYRDPSTRPRATEIARTLGGIDYLLEGSARIAGDRVRITVQLIDGRTDGHLWSEVFDDSYSVESSIEVQSEIASQIARALQVGITPEESFRISAVPTEDLEAYQLYLLGLDRFYARSRENLRQAIRYFEAAIQQDSTFAEAWAGLANAWTVVPWYEPIDSREAYAEARVAAEQALRLNEDLAEVHAALGGIALHDDWDWEKAEAHLTRALDLNPNYAQAYHWLSTTHRTMGLRDQAIRELEEGVRHNPLGNNFHYALANYLYDAGRIEEAKAAYQAAAALEPPVAWGLLMMSVFLVQQGWTDDALRGIQRWGEVIGYPNHDRLHVVVRAFEEPELAGEALSILEDVRQERGLLERDMAVVVMNLQTPEENLRLIRELIARRDIMVLSAGLAYTRAKVLEYPEIKAAIEGIGVNIL